jgi:hypothetical protein
MKTFIQIKDSVNYYKVSNNENTEGVAIYTIYDITTKDYPGKYVLRRFMCNADEVCIDIDPIGVNYSLDEVRKLLPKDVTKLGQFMEDDPVILETYL